MTVTILTILKTKNRNLKMTEKTSLIGQSEKRVKLSVDEMLSNPPISNEHETYFDSLDFQGLNFPCVDESLVVSVAIDDLEYIYKIKNCH
ncbi:unnamed protein product [Acanthoscelides obtectus]|uniref:Uncharacterized protein n=1 Tax=Acanthoscelides obtectus TaxID=200917 RepID=A0A9P0KMY2_ACAOB|nr:unnamed protein product [Acanthoscelides obtectus]CAK1654479.1 hypothetical protein AOBTE_LOCUS18629 [Acanthoscelides obtectus]